MLYAGIRTHEHDAPIGNTMPQSTLILLLTGVCIFGTITRSYAQDPTERHGITAGMGIGTSWVSRDLCPPRSCDAGVGVNGQVGWVWRSDWALLWAFTETDAGGIGSPSLSGPSFNVNLRVD